MGRRASLVACIAAGLISLLIAVSGGVVASAGGVRLSARSWQPSAVLGIGLWLWWAREAHRARTLRRDAEWLTRSLEQHGPLLARLIAGLACVAALGFSTYSPAGADASGYLSQADMWARGALEMPDRLQALRDWPLDPGATAPLGWRPALSPGAQVPTYAPGLPWLMAVPVRLFGTAGGVIVVAAAAAIGVWSAAALAAAIGGPLAGVMAASLLATSPTFLYQAFQPMSDVPVTSAWLVCWWLVARGATGRAGAAAAIAVAVRPNLAPLAAVPWVVAMGTAPRALAGRAAVAFGAPVAVAGALIAWLQWRWYGSPLQSGYGSANELFALGHATTNARAYLGWFLEAERELLLAGTGAVAACVLSCRVAGADRDGARPADAGRVRGLIGGTVVFAAGVVCAYLVYAVFEVWSYLRFLLPALSLAGVIVAATAAFAARKVPAAWRGCATVVFVAALMTTGLHTARQLRVFQVEAEAGRARVMGRALTRVLPGTAVILAAEQSGSMRYLTGRPLVRWDTLDSRSLRATLDRLMAEGLDPWWVLDQFEEPLVRARFPGVPEAALLSAPDVQAGTLVRTRAWRIAPPTGAP